ncbi:MAG: hypothetical protein V4592_13125 [Bacteroidota bacterium]
MKKKIILLVMFVIIVIVVWQIQRKRGDESSKLLQNNVVFSGKISKIKISSNHNFGIVFLQTSNAVNLPETPNQGNKRFPYLVINGLAEVYTRVPDGINVGDSIKVISNLETVYYCDNIKKKTEEYIYMIDDPIDIKFITENTNFK